VDIVPCPVVALVSSAGGLSATTQVLHDLPEDFPACVLVLQHTSPYRRDRLPEVLGARVARPVKRAEDGALLTPGMTWVAPAGCHMLVTPQWRLSLIISGTFPPARPSADLLLASMALSVGEAAIAVIMTGSGHDGATGATAVHKHSGLVVTTDESTSEHFSMPRSTIERDNVVDEVVPVHHVADYLVRRLVTAGSGR
jgi:two-component system, chemotaxis family, protein-glutamate methylesterase/glutaminase